MTLKTIFFRFAAALLFLPAGLWAQTGATGTILGTVTDSSGGVVAGATVTATNIDTDFKRSVTSESSGDFSIPSLPIGRYNLRAELGGFRAAEVKGTELTIDQHARINLQLTVGQVKDTVTVEGQPPVLKTDDSSTSQVITQKAIVDLPLNGRNFIQLSRLTAGVNTGDNYNITSAGVIGDQAPGSVYGQRNNANQFRLDGIQTTEFTGNRARLEPNIDAIQEFTLIKGIYPAEYGGIAGGTINVAIKSGTNQLHGTLFEFLRNNDLDARNFFDKTGHTAPLRRNQFGATAGGKIIKDKLFFFGSYDGLRLTQGSVGTTVVPTTAQVNGDFSATGKKIIDPLTHTPFAGDQIPASRINPIGRALAALYPSPNSPDPARNYVSANSEIFHTDQFLGRADYRLGDKDQFFAHYAHAKLNDAAAPIISPFADHGLDRSQSAVLAYTHSFSSSILNEARFGYTRIATNHASLSPDPNFAASANIPGVTRDPAFADVPAVSVSGYAGLGTAVTSPYFNVQNNFEYVDNFFVVKGKHSLKMGIDILRVQKLQEIPETKKGSFTFDANYSGDNFADLLLGVPRATAVGQSPYVATGNLRTWNLPSYIQDDWRILPNLTLNIGLRYEYIGAPVDVRGSAISFNPYSNMFQPAPLTPGKSIYHTDKNNLAPRFGFAYRPFKDAKTVVRGGYGLFYTANNYDEFLFLPYNPPFGNVLTFNSSPTTPTLSLSNPFPSGLGTPPTPTAYGVAPDFKIGYVQFYTFGIEREIMRDTVLEISYVGNKSTDLAKAINVNYAPAGPGAVQPRRVARTDLANVVVTFPSSNATYNSLQAQLERHFSNGLYLLTSYAYGKALDDVAGSQGDKGSATAQNPLCVNSCEKGPPAYDLRQRYTLNFVYQLPFGKGRAFLNRSGLVNEIAGGWEVGTIFGAQTGQLLTITESGDPINTGQANARPNYVGGPVQLSDPTINRFFNTSAFVAAPLYTPGNAGRGILSGPGLVTWDFSAYKTWVLRERSQLQFRSEFFNVLNHTNFGSPGTVLGTSTYGVITGAGASRDIQFALKYSF
jgi:hypothetical protein